MAEQLPRMPDELFLDALTDAAMTAAGAASAMFPANVVSIKLGGDAGLNDQSGTVSLPLPLTVITIASAYMRDEFYTAPDPNDTSGRPIADAEVTVPFTVWASNASALAETRRRLMFVRDHRAFVFSLHGLTLIGQMVPERRRPLDPTTGLFGEDYRWHFQWSRQ